MFKVPIVLDLFNLFIAYRPLAHVIITSIPPSHEFLRKGSSNELIFLSVPVMAILRGTHLKFTQLMQKSQRTYLIYREIISNTETDIILKTILWFYQGCCACGGPANRSISVREIA